MFQAFICMKEKLLLFLLLLPLLASSQLTSNNADTYTWFDKKVGYENTGLLNGVEYLEKHITINEKHQFFRSAYFLTGNISYKGQPYFQLPVKYNVFDDLLLVKLKKREGEATFELHKESIDAFSIGSQRFVNVREEADKREISGFYEILLEREQFQLLKKHRKKRKKLLDRDFTYYEFEEDEPLYAVHFNNKYAWVNTQNEVQVLFDNQPLIRQYYRANKNLYKIDRDKFMTGLFQEILPQDKTQR